MDARVTNPPPPNGGDISERIAQYVQVRARIKEIEERHEQELAKWKELQNGLAGIIQAHLTATGVDSVKTKGGTAYLSRRYTASLRDPGAFMKYVIEAQAFDLLDRKANATAVREFVKKQGELPPGCELSTIQTLGIRKAGTKAE